MKWIDIIKNSLYKNTKYRAKDIPFAVKEYMDNNITGKDYNKVHTFSAIIRDVVQRHTKDNITNRGYKGVDVFFKIEEKGTGSFYVLNEDFNPDKKIVIYKREDKQPINNSEPKKKIYKQIDIQQIAK